MVEVAYATPNGMPPVKLVVIDTGGVDRPRGATSYPLNGLDASQLHPFFQAAPPQGFPTFGEYIKDYVEIDPALAGALPAPTWGQVNGYLDRLLELAAISFADIIELDLAKGKVARVREAVPGGPATIVLVDGTELLVSRIVRGRTPAYLGGRAEFPTGFLAVEVERLVASSGLPVEKPVGAGADPGFDLVFAIATGRIAVEAVELPETDLEAHVRGALMPKIGPAGIGQLWIVTRTAVSEAMARGFAGQRVRFVSLPEVAPLLKRLADAARHPTKS
jgi:hypothetical protein